MQLLLSPSPAPSSQRKLCGCSWKCPCWASGTEEEAPAGCRADDRRRRSLAPRSGSEPVHHHHKRPAPSASCAYRCRQLVILRSQDPPLGTRPSRRASAQHVLPVCILQTLWGSQTQGTGGGWKEGGVKVRRGEIFLSAVAAGR